MGFVDPKQSWTGSESPVVSRQASVWVALSRHVMPGLVPGIHVFLAAK
jgi:hypothetical protein